MTQEKPSFIAEFFQKESAGGMVLCAAAIIAIIIANSPLEPYYELLLSTPMEIRVGALEIAKPLLLWINDGLMAIFFFLIGLELKRELIEGELADRRNIILPAVGAIGGMAMPAVIYLAFNHQDPVSDNGWAIPAATDIAFALGVLALLGSKVPTALKVFITSLAIFDDVGAIIIIALFYTDNLSIEALVVVIMCLPILFYLNKTNVVTKSPYVLISIVVWVATLKSGVHATLAGVLVAMFIPIRNENDPHDSPLKVLEHDLHPIVTYFVLPVFAFANAGLNVTGVTSEQFFHGVPMGIALGLFFGKQIGIFGLCYVCIKLGFSSLPNKMTWTSLYATSALCGIGFTMSLFIGSLAFEQTGAQVLFDERLGILLGSILSGIFGYWLLNRCLEQAATNQ